MHRPALDPKKKRAALAEYRAHPERFVSVIAAKHGMSTPALSNLAVAAGCARVKKMNAVIVNATDFVRLYQERKARQ